jgi:hypothetical protein
LDIIMLSKCLQGKPVLKPTFLNKCLRGKLVLEPIILYKGLTLDSCSRCFSIYKRCSRPRVPQSQRPFQSHHHHGSPNHLLWHKLHRFQCLRPHSPWRSQLPLKKKRSSPQWTQSGPFLPRHQHQRPCLFCLMFHIVPHSPSVQGKCVPHPHAHLRGIPPLSHRCRGGERAPHKYYSEPWE